MRILENKAFFLFKLLKTLYTKVLWSSQYRSLIQPLRVGRKEYIYNREKMCVLKRFLPKQFVHEFTIHWRPADCSGHYTSLVISLDCSRPTRAIQTYLVNAGIKYKFTRLATISLWPNDEYKFLCFIYMWYFCRDNFIFTSYQLKHTVKIQLHASIFISIRVYLKDHNLA